MDSITEDDLNSAEPPGKELGDLEELLQLSSSILETKLKVLAAELLQRFQLREVFRMDEEGRSGMPAFLARSAQAYR